MTYSPNFRGTTGKGSSRQLVTNYQNGTGLTLVQGTPVSINVSGQIVAVDVSDPLSVAKLVGFCAEDILSAAIGKVIDSGRLENVTIGYSVGSALWISKAGFLINVAPDYGVNGFAAGDFIVFVGVVVENEFNPADKDIKISLDKIGIL